MTNDESKDILKELKQIKMLLLSILIVYGVDAETLAKVLGYKRGSSITNEIPVNLLKKVVPSVRILDETERKATKRRIR